MSFTNDQKKTLGNNGFRQSSNDENKYIRDNGHSVTSSGNKVTFNTDNHTTNHGISNSLFDKKTSR